MFVKTATSPKNFEEAIAFCTDINGRLLGRLAAKILLKNQGGYLANLIVRKYLGKAFARFIDEQKRGDSDRD